jgi:hypothetical protein
VYMCVCLYIVGGRGWFSSGVSIILCLGCVYIVQEGEGSASRKKENDKRMKSEGRFVSYKRS